MTQTPNTGSAATPGRGHTLEVLLAAASLLLATQLGWIVVEYWASLPAPGRQVEIRSPDAPYPYLVFLPEGYAAGDRKWPLILHLHGSGERGHDLRAVRTTSLPRLLDKGRKVPAIVVSPQCPLGETWSGDAIVALADALARRFAIDQRRLYATGYSMGGYATWEVGWTFPGRFAAIVPICGGGPAAWGPPFRRGPFTEHGMTPCRQMRPSSLSKRCGRPGGPRGSRSTTTWDTEFGIRCMPLTKSTSGSGRARLPRSQTIKARPTRGSTVHPERGRAP